MPLSEQDYWNALEALRTEYTARLARLEDERQRALGGIPEAGKVLAEYQRALQAAETARAEAYRRIDDARERAVEAATSKRPAALAKVERELRDVRLGADRVREDARRKARDEYEAALRKIETKFPLHAQTGPKAEAAAEHERALVAADQARDRAWSRAWESYQNAHRDVLDDERIAVEKADVEARRERAAADGHHADTIRNAEAILRSRLSAVAGAVQTRYDSEYERLAAEWESRKDELSRRYRQGRPRRRKRP